MRCKVCKKELFVELDYRTLFKLNYTIHESCKKLLEEEMKIEVIPIENNTIKWIYFFDSNIDICSQFVELYLIGKGMEYCIVNREWSIINWMTSDEYHLLDELTKYLFLKLGDQSLVFLSLFRNM